MGREESMSTRHSGLTMHRMSGQLPEDRAGETTGDVREAQARLERVLNAAMLHIQALF